MQRKMMPTLAELREEAKRRGLPMFVLLRELAKEQREVKDGADLRR